MIFRKMNEVFESGWGARMVDIIIITWYNNIILYYVIDLRIVYTVEHPYNGQLRMWTSKENKIKYVVTR